MAAIRSWLALAVLGTVCGAVLAAVPAAAQTPADTRAEEIAKEQEAKARELHPYTPNRFEKRLLAIEEAGGLSVVRGWFVSFGDIKQGSGFALGPAYAKLFDNGAVIVAKGGYSLRNFKLAQVAVSAPPLARGRVHIGGRARWQDAPELAVYALGRDSPKVRADYAETMTEVSGQIRLTPVSFLRFETGAAFQRFETGGADTARSSVEELFTPAEMPGIGIDADYLHTFASAAIDSRAGEGYSRSGSLLEATLHDYRQQNSGRYSFQRVDGTARQLIPILHGNWVIDLSVRASTTTADDGDQVPFFLMPYLGGGGDLRGFSSYRFRDRHSIIFTGEYRWYVQEFVDMAVFYDAGKVASRRSDLDFDGLKSDAGIGIRFHGPRTTLLRVEAAKSREGLRIIFAFSAPVR